MWKNQRTRTRSASELSESKTRRRLTAGTTGLLQRKAVSGRITKAEVEDYYAGAEFDTVPQVRNRQFPSLPKHWELNDEEDLEESPRSQSLPSSPITVSTHPPSLSSSPPRVFVKLDLETLFGPKKTSLSSTQFHDTELGRLLISGLSKHNQETNPARDL